MKYLADKFQWALLKKEVVSMCRYDNGGDIRGYTFLESKGARERQKVAPTLKVARPFCSR